MADAPPEDVESTTPDTFKFIDTMVLMASGSDDLKTTVSK